MKYIRQYIYSIIMIFALLVLNVIKLPELAMRDYRIMNMDIGMDKWQHALAYFVFTLLLTFEMTKNGKSSKLIAVAFVSSVSLGILLEGLQYLLPYRTFNPYDILANMTGALFALVVFYAYKRISR